MGLLRLLLAVSVAANHFGGLPLFGVLLGGVADVEGFFILSGFYMALVLHERYQKIGQFYRNRLARIFSGYWIAVAFAIAVKALHGKLLFTEIANAHWDLPSKLLMFTSNIFLFGSDLMVFLYPGKSGITFTPNFLSEPAFFYGFHYIPQAWSIPVELCFYLLAPFIVRSIPRIAFFALFGLAVRYWSYWQFGQIDPWTYRFFPSELTFFMLGAASYHGYRLVGRTPLVRRMGLIFLIAIAFFMLSFYGLELAKISYVVIDKKLWPFYILFAASIPFIFVATSESRVDRFLGDLSYMVYLNHLSVYQLLSPWSENPFVVIGATLVFAYLMQRLAEPLESRLRGRKPVASKYRLSGTVPRQNPL